MVDNIHFKKFRGFKDLLLSDLKPITLISGKNNAGKSSILEGIFLMFDHATPEVFFKINHFRGLVNASTPTSLWEPLFCDLDPEDALSIEMTLRGDCVNLSYMKDSSFVPTLDMNISPDILNQFISSAKTMYSLKMRYTTDVYSEDAHFLIGPNGILRHIETNQVNNQVRPMPRTIFINSVIANSDTSIAEWFGRLELEGKKQTAIDILRIIDPRISDVSAITINGAVQLHAKIESKMFPLKLAGDGINRLLYIILAIMAHPNSLILIDEIETGFHYSMYSKLWNAISVVVKECNCQVIATTHSHECIAGAVDTIEATAHSDSFCYFRLDRNETSTKAYRYSTELLRTALNTDMEVR